MPQSRFIFSGYTWDTATQTATVSYRVFHKEEEFHFKETISFPKRENSTKVPDELLNILLANLSLALGISYYKLFCPREISLESVQLSQEQAVFWNTVYTKGLGEFFFQNKIDFRGLISFPVSGYGSKPVTFLRQNRSLVGIGGGKDSIITAEILKRQQKEFDQFILSPHPLQEEVSMLVGHKTVVVTRTIDSQLFELNKREDAYNGHIPISAIYAFIGLFTAVFADYRYVIVSNEQSSNYGNVTYLNMEINHQWSKSYEFEKLFQEYVKTFITPDVTYFSLLRPLTELAIVKEFVKYPQYFAHFSSCNRNFRITGKGSDTKWCGECAKCAFAFIMLAAFLPKEQVREIFGEDLLGKESLLQTYKELLGVVNMKPFDCVGTPEEVIVAFSLADKQGGYHEDLAMRFFKEEVLPNVTEPDNLAQKVFAKSEQHAVPAEFTYEN